MALQCNEYFHSNVLDVGCMEFYSTDVDLEYITHKNEIVKELTNVNGCQISLSFVLKT